LYRFGEYDGQDYWRLVNTYESHNYCDRDIGQRLQMIDWKWLVGILLTLLSIPAQWGIFKKNKNESMPQAKRQANDPGNVVLSQRRADFDAYRNKSQTTSTKANGMG